MATANKNFKVKNGLDVNGAIAATSTISASGLAGSLLTSTSPSMDGSVSAGTSTVPARADHVHPTDTSRAPLASPTFTGTISGVDLTLTGAIQSESGTKDNITTRTKAGFFQTANATTATGWPETTNSWYHLMSSTHSNGGNYYALQIASSFYNTDNVYVRATNGSGTSAWKRLLHEGNTAHIHPFLLSGI